MWAPKLWLQHQRHLSSTGEEAARQVSKTAEQTRWKEKSSWALSLQGDLTKKSPAQYFLYLRPLVTSSSKGWGLPNRAPALLPSLKMINVIEKTFKSGSWILQFDIFSLFDVGYISTVENVHGYVARTTTEPFPLHHAHCIVANLVTWEKFFNAFLSDFHTIIIYNSISHSCAGRAETNRSIWI